MKQLSITLFLLSLLFCCNAQKDSAMIIFERGLKNYDIKNYNQALINFNDAIHADSTYAEAYYYRGLVNMIPDSTKTKAYYDFDKAIKMGINKADAFLYRGKMLLYVDFGYRELYLSVLSDMNKALEMDSTLSDAYISRGLTVLDIYKDSLQDTLSGNIPVPDYIYKKMIADFTKAIKYDSNHISAYFDRAMCRYEIGDKAGACEDYKRAGELGLAVY